MNRYRECKHDEGAGHDCAYVDSRNRLIPRAWAEAQQAASGFGVAKDAEAARVFFGVMNRLCNTPNAPRPEPTNGVSNHRRYVA